MTQKEFESKYEIVWGEPKTLNSGKVNVQFNKRQASLRDRETGVLTPTNVYVDDGSEELGEVLVLERYVAKPKVDDRNG